MHKQKAIAEALSRIRSIADQNKAEIIRFDQMTRADRELLTRSKWLQEVIRGWYILARPDIAPGDSAAWYANFWDFLRVYLNHHYGDHYCLSAESSLDLHVESTLIPKQVIVIVPKGGGGTPKELLYDTSLLVYSDAKGIPAEREIRNGLQIMSLSLSLCKVPTIYFQKNSQDAEIALLSLRSSAELSRIILTYELKSAAGRLIGAYRFLGKEKMAKEIEENLAVFGMKVKIENPFTTDVALIREERIRSPYAARIGTLWNEFRETIIKIFPSEKGLPGDIASYLENVKHIYSYDAYNSLSIEGYKVTPKLIEHVENNHWNPDQNSEDANERNALAARGYYETHLVVMESLEKILKGATPGETVQDDLQTWYRNLFAPSVRAHILSPNQLMGYRKNKVYIRNSRHTPPTHEALHDAMETFFSCLTHEPHAAVRAVLGHYFFVFIHPYMDGNGRLARFLMNVMFASGGYCWTVVRVERRQVYLDALAAADIDRNIKPLASFILEEMQATEDQTT